MKLPSGPAFRSVPAARLFAALLGAFIAAGPARADIGAGEESFARLCASCHGENGRGEGAAASGLTPPPADLTILRDENGGVFPRDQIIAVIDGRDWLDAHGGRAMPIWGDVFSDAAGGSLEGEFGDTEEVVIEWIEDLVDYIETLQR